MNKTQSNIKQIGIYRSDLSGKIIFINDYLNNIISPNTNIIQEVNTNFFKIHSLASSTKEFPTAFEVNSVWKVADKSLLYALEFIKIDKDAHGNIIIESIVSISQNLLLEKLQTNQVFLNNIDPIAVCDLNDRVIAVNNSFAEYFGYTQEELQFNEFPGHFGFDDGVFDVWLATCRAGIGVEHHKSKRRKKSGEVIDVLISVSPYKDSFGNLVALIIWYKDINKIIEQEREISIKNDILNQINDAVIQTDDELKISYWNKAAERIYGWSESDAIGKQMDELLQTEFNDSTQIEARRELINNGTWNGHLYQVSKLGKDLDIEAHVSILRDDENNFIGGVTVNRDISKRIEMENKLNESLKLYKKLIDYSPLGISLTHNDNMIYSNDKLLKIFGFDTVEEMQKFPRGAFIHPEDRQRVTNLIKSNHTKEILNVSYRIINNKNDLRYINLTFSKIRVNNKNYFQGLFLDETLAKKKQLSKKELAAESVIINQKNKMIAELRDAFFEIVNKYNIAEDDVNVFKRIVRGSYNPKKDWQHTKKLFENVHEDFFKDLLEKYPNLTKNELQHIAYMKMNFSTKEIARIYNVQPESIQKARTRIKKKMKLGKDVDLYTFIHKIV